MSAVERTLGKLAKRNGKLYYDRGWNALVRGARGRSNMSETVGKLPHTAARYLDHLRKRGAGVWTTTTPWELSRRDQAVARGAHQSAHLDRDFVLEEMLDFCTQGYWIILPYEVVRD
jgi:hypothetical protein